MTIGWRGAAIMVLAGATSCAPVPSNGPAELRQAAPMSAAPSLNHLYVVVDQATFDALRGSRAVAAMLGRADGGLPDYAAPSADADRVFFRGRRTYLEVFGPDNRFGEPVGKAGLAIGADHSATFERIVRGWRHACGEGFSTATVSWTRSEPPVPWYESIQCEATATRNDVAVWAMLYRPEFARWQAPGVAGVGDIRREAILAPRRADGQGRFDVTGVTMRVDATLRAALVAQFVAAGFVHEQAGGAARLRGDGFELLIEPGEAGAMVTAIGLTTDGAAAGSAELGSARIERVDAETVRLRFPGQRR